MPDHIFKGYNYTQPELLRHIFTMQVCVAMYIDIVIVIAIYGSKDEANFQS